MYFAKLYKLGLLRKRPYSQAWRYREEIRKMHRLHDQYLFLSEYEIHSTSELEQICEKMKKRQQKCTAEKRSYGFFFIGLCRYLQVDFSERISYH